MSLRTTSSSNIFGTIVKDEIEYIPWVVPQILLSVLDGEQGLVKEKNTYIFT
jgi:hypothetical protein